MGEELKIKRFPYCRSGKVNTAVIPVTCNLEVPGYNLDHGNTLDEFPSTDNSQILPNSSLFKIRGYIPPVNSGDF